MNSPSPDINSKDRLVVAISTGLYTGLFPIVPGTIGTIPAWALGYFAFRENASMLAMATVVLTLISIWAAGAAEARFGHDSKKIVIDEWAGMFVTLLFTPPTLGWYCAAFAAFRFFDVLKLWPAAQAEQLPRGWGVTADDIVAGLQAGVTVSIFVRWIIPSA